jgi:parallel beta-helix repeat protein
VLLKFLYLEQITFRIRRKVELLRKTVSGIMLTLLLIGMLTLAFNVQPVKASGTVYIRADGSIDPPTAPIQRDGDVYIFTNNIHDSIIIERDNIVLDGRGYTLGPGNLYAIQVSERTNVTIKRINIQLSSSDVGIYLDWSSHNSILENSITGSDWTFDCIILDSSSDNTISGNSINGCGTDLGSGVHLYSSSNNTISENSIISNSLGIFLEDFSSNNTVSGNNITANNYYDIYLYRSSSNTVYGNNITANYYSRIYLDGSSNNKFYHNNFINNGFQVYSEDSANVWDDGYPSGGNYWSDYVGVDVRSGSNQDLSGSDGIVDTPYIIDANNRDRYPLTKPYGGPHDIGITNLTTSKTVIGKGYSLNITVKIINYGINTETFNLTIYANTSVIQSLTNIVLTSRNSTTITFTWNTTGFAKGNYTIWAYATPIPGETDTDDNRFTGGVVTVTVAGDLDGNFAVQLVDLVILAKAYGSKPSEPPWNPNADLDDNGVVGLTDLVALAKNYGKTDP